MKPAILTLLYILISPLLAHSANPKTSWSGIAKEADKAILSKNYERLDYIADYYTSTDAQMEYGIPCIYRFYKYIGGAPNADIAFFEDWEMATASDVATLSKANAYIKSAWKARGSGYSNSVTAEGWDVFKERLSKAEEILVGNPGLKRHPAYFSALQATYHGLAKSHDEYFELVSEAISLHPESYTIRYDAIYYLTPRWYGSNELWLDYAEQTFDTVPEDVKYKVYARLLLFQFTFFDNIFTETGVSWERAKQGFEEILKETGNDEYTYAGYTYLACIKGDKDTAKKLFQNKRSKYLKAYPLFNKNDNSYESWVKWSGLRMEDVERSRGKGHSQ